MIDMINRDEPIFVSSPRSTSPNEKIVGNIIETKKPKPHKAYTVYSPFPKMAMAQRMVQMIAYMVSSFCCLINFKKKVPIKRPVINNKAYIPKYLAAVSSSKPPPCCAIRIKKEVMQTWAPTYAN